MRKFVKLLLPISLLSITLSVNAVNLKKIAYVTNSEMNNYTSDVVILPALKANANFEITEISSLPIYTDYSSYDLVIISDVPSSSDPGMRRLMNIKKPVLMMKVDSYTSSQNGWNWLTSTSEYGSDSVNTKIQVEYKTHPIFSGVTFTGTGNNEVSMLTSVKDKKGISFANSSNILVSGGSIINLATIGSSSLAVSIFEIPVGTTITERKANPYSMTLVKRFIQIGINSSSYSTVSSEAIKIITNACNYLADTLSMPFKLVTAIEIDKGNYTIPIGGTLQLNAKVFPGDASNTGINWTVNNNLATINSNGLLTAINSGTVKVYATAIDESGIKDSVNVTITKTSTSTEPITYLKYKVTTFDAEIIVSSLSRAEMSSCLDKLNRTHIAWIDRTSSKCKLMYSLYDNKTVTTTQINTGSETDNKLAPSIIVDDNNNPHIVMCVRRVPGSYLLNNGNYSDLYAGYNGSSWEVLEVATNPIDPTKKLTTDPFTCDLYNWPRITLLPNNQVAVFYLSDYCENYIGCYWIISAIKSGSTWIRAQEVALFSVSQYDVTRTGLPQRMNSNYFFAWCDLKDYNVRWASKTSGIWSHYKINEYKGYLNIHDVNSEMDEQGKYHIMYEASNSGKLFHAVITNNSYSKIDSVKPSRTYGRIYSSIDVANGNPVFAYTSSSDTVGFITYSDNKIVEKKIKVAMSFYGPRGLNSRNGFISLVGANLTTKQIVIVTSDPVVTTSTKDANLNNDEKLKIFPNPVSDQLKLVIPETGASSSQIKIYDITGKLKYSNTTQQNNITINLKELNFGKGGYVIQVNNNRQQLTSKFIFE